MARDRWAVLGCPRYARVATTLIADTTRADGPMCRTALEVADIFRRHGAAYRADQAGSRTSGQRRLMAAIDVCRTAALGCHVLDKAHRPPAQSDSALSRRGSLRIRQSRQKSL
jgi:hypothetical protein